MLKKHSETLLKQLIKMPLKHNNNATIKQFNNLTIQQFKQKQLKLTIK